MSEVEFGDYERLPVDVKAIQITEDNSGDVARWLIDNGLEHMVGPAIPVGKWLVSEVDTDRVLFVRPETFWFHYRQPATPGAAVTTPATTPPVEDQPALTPQARELLTIARQKGWAGAERSLQLVDPDTREALIRGGWARETERGRLLWTGWGAGDGGARRGAGRRAALPPRRRPPGFRRRAQRSDRRRRPASGRLRPVESGTDDEPFDVLPEAVQRRAVVADQVFDGPECGDGAVEQFLDDVVRGVPDAQRGASGGGVVGGRLHLPVGRISVETVLRNWKPGSNNWTWVAEGRDLYARDFDVMEALVESIRDHGFRPALPGEDPICLGSDGRIWEGHHRLLAAYIVDDMLRLPEDAYMGHETPLTEAGNPHYEDWSGLTTIEAVRSAAASAALAGSPVSEAWKSRVSESLDAPDPDAALEALVTQRLAELAQEADVRDDMRTRYLKCAACEDAPAGETGLCTECLDAGDDEPADTDPCEVAP